MEFSAPGTPPDAPSDLDSIYSLVDRVISDLHAESLSQNTFTATNTLALQIRRLSTHAFTELHALCASAFPELDSFNLSSPDYARVIQSLRASPSPQSADLNFLHPSTAMAIAITASSSPIPLNSSDSTRITDLLSHILLLDSSAARLVEALSAVILRVAPNLSAVVGTPIAAQLVSHVGGVLHLSQTPSSSIQVLGASRTQTPGMSATVTRRAGFIAQTDLVRYVSPDLFVKAQRVVAAKCAIAARADAVRSAADGSVGRRLRADAEQKIAKMQEPPPVVPPKPLPVPKLEHGPQRGGRRARKMKELYAMTEVRKQQNRMAFGVAQHETIVNSSVAEHGMLGVEGGTFRSTRESDVLRNKIKNSVKTPAYGTGTSTSLAFGAAQGIELATPKMQTPADKTPRFFRDQFSFNSMPKS